MPVTTTMLIVACIASIATLLILDAIWLKSFLGPFFRERIGHMMREDPKLGVAALFYLFYAIGAVYFATYPALVNETWTLALLNGAILGFLAYGTFEATNMTILKDYQWSLVIVDVLWGIVVTAASATIAFFAARLVA